MLQLGLKGTTPINIEQPLHIKYRPTDWDEVIGQDAVVRSMSKTIERKGSRAFLLYGPAGTGKTTLARIAAKHFGCRPNAINEIDAATHTGIDDTRSIQELIRYAPFGASKVRVIIIDEAHGLSRQAWDSLLKSVEQPPAHLCWFFCTTNAGRVPMTIRTRCTAFELKPLEADDLHHLIEEVCKLEKIKLKEGVQTLIVRNSEGSPRQALVNLAVCRDAENRKDAAKLLTTALEGEATIDLCRFLIQPQGGWPKAMSIIERLNGESPEGVRIIVSNYFGKVLKDEKSERKVLYYLGILDNFATPYSSAEGMAPLLLSIGRTVFNQE